MLFYLGSYRLHAVLMTAVLLPVGDNYKHDVLSAILLCRVSLGITDLVHGSPHSIEQSCRATNLVLLFGHLPHSAQIDPIMEELVTMIK